MRGLLLLLATFALAASAHALDISANSFTRNARSSTDVLVAPLVQTPPIIDGKLDDACWANAGNVPSFWKGNSKETAEDQTIAWVAYDADNLYVAFACRDQAIRKISPEHDSKLIWQNDSVEVWLSPTRDRTAEYEYILCVGDGRYERDCARKDYDEQVAWNPTPAWEGKTLEQPWGYTAELKIPLAPMLDRTAFDLARGATWNLKLTRLDCTDNTGQGQFSGWVKMGPLSNDPNAYGKLSFIDTNLLTNGNAEQTDAAGVAGWKTVTDHSTVTSTIGAEQVKEGHHSAKVTYRWDARTAQDNSYATLSFGAPAPHRQPAKTIYLFSADLNVAAGADATQFEMRIPRARAEEKIAIKNTPGWQHIETWIAVEPGQQLTPPFLHASPAAKQGPAADGGIIYIDNVRLEVDTPADLPSDAAAVCLTGNAIGNLAARNQPVAGRYSYFEPMTTATQFPNWLQGTPVAEVGAYAGWIPFKDGKLTDGLTSTEVQWATYWTGALGHDIVFDLGQDYLISRVESLGRICGYFSVYLKTSDAPTYYLAATNNSLYDVDLAQIKVPSENHGVFDSLNQSARYVRVQIHNKSKAPSEIRIWGKPLTPGMLPARTPFLQNNGTVVYENPTGDPVSYKDVPAVYPVPHEMKFAGPGFVLKDGLTIGFDAAGGDSGGRAKITAEVLAEEFQLSYGLKLIPQPGSGDIQLSEGSDLQKPQGYTLQNDGQKIIIRGSDPQGTFYGTQSLLQLVRAASGGGGLEIPGVTIRDWPDMPIRYIQGRPAPDKNLIRALARFRVTHYESGRSHQDVGNLDEWAERHFVSLVPNMDFNTVVFEVDPTLVERPATEKLEDVPVGRRNANPAHPRTWEIYFAELDKRLPQYRGKYVHVGLDETYQSHAGARWNVSPESRALNLTGGQLIAWFLKRIDEKCKQYGKTIVMHDTMFLGHSLSYPGDPDPAWNKALDLIPKDVTFLVWHPEKCGQMLRDRGHDVFYLALDEFAWERLQLPGPYTGLAHYMAESSFTPGKLLALIGPAWNTAAPRTNSVAARNTISRYIPEWNELQLNVRLPSARALANDFVPLDLRKVANRTRTDDAAYDGKGWVDLGSGCDLRALLPGVQELGGTPFDIIDESQNKAGSVVMVQNRSYTDRVMPTEVAIPIANVQAASLVFLHVLENRPGFNYLRRSELAGFYHIIYEDDTYATMDIKYAVNTANWDGRPIQSGYNPKDHTMTNGQLVWTGQTRCGLPAFLYTTEWINPRPDLKIKQILLRSAYKQSNMNPMLLGVTATSARLAENAASKPKLPSVAQLAPAQPVGSPLDLRGGIDESDTRYVAPDGAIIQTDVLDNTLADKNRWNVLEYHSNLGMVNQDMNQRARTNTAEYVFPKPTVITGALVIGAYRQERKTENFSDARCDVVLETSADNGQTWTAQSSALDTCPEMFGPAWLPLKDNTPITRLRIRIDKVRGNSPGGIQRIQLYQP